MRGKEFRMLYAYGNSRITPAYAGKRLERVPLIPSRQDHPRLCGEKRSGAAKTMQSVGSPPPMRGKVLYGRDYLLQCRDHPRLCGEKQGQKRGVSDV